MKQTLLALFPCWIALAWLVSKVQWVWNSRPDMQFGWIVLMLSAYLFYEKSHDLPARVFKPGLVNICGFVFGVGLLFIVQVYQAFFGMNSASLLGHFLGTQFVILANLHYVYGKAGLIGMSFPFLFLAVAMPMPSIIQGPLVSNLQQLVSSICVETLNLIGVHAQKTGSLIQLSNGILGVDEACSGIRSLQSTFMASLFIGYVTLKHVSLRVTLFIAGVFLAILGNIIRAFTLSYIASQKGIEAVDTAHDTAGWMILAFTVVGVLAVTWVLGSIEKKSIHRITFPTPNPDPVQVEHRNETII